MDTIPLSDSDQETLTVTDIYADIGKSPDPTGDFADGRDAFSRNLGGVHRLPSFARGKALGGSLTGKLCPHMKNQAHSGVITPD